MTDTKASKQGSGPMPHIPPPYTASGAPGVTGKSGEAVPPATTICWDASIVTALALSDCEPPRKVEYRRELPDGFTFETNPSTRQLSEAFSVRFKRLGVVGKSIEEGSPTTTA